MPRAPWAAHLEAVAALARRTATAAAACGMSDEAVQLLKHILQPLSDSTVQVARAAPDLVGPFVTEPLAMLLSLLPEVRCSAAATILGSHMHLGACCLGPPRLLPANGVLRSLLCGCYVLASSSPASSSHARDFPQTQTQSSQDESSARMVVECTELLLGDVQVHSDRCTQALAGSCLLEALVAAAQLLSGSDVESDARLVGAYGLVCV